MENQTMQDAPPIQTPQSFSIEESQTSTPQHHQLTASPEAQTLSPESASVQAVADAPQDTQGNSAPTQLSRDQILDATWLCLCEKGYDATTIRQIAARLDCAIGSIYRYYRDKHDLLSCVTQRPFEAVAEAVEAGESFPATARMYVKRAAGEAQSYGLMFWLSNQKHKGSETQTPAAFRLPDVIARIIQGWSQQTGSKQASLARWSVLHGAVTAGADALALLTSMGMMNSAGQLNNTSSDTSIDDEPHDRTAQQIVTVMRTPPMPKPKVAVASEPKHATASHVRQKEDVCLL